MARVTITSVAAPEGASRAAHGGARLVATATAIVVGAGVVIGLVVGFLAVWWGGVIAALGAAGGLWLGLVAPRLRSAESRAVDLVGPSRAATARDDARLLNLIEGLAPTAGLPRPRVLVIEDDTPNAVAFGRDGRRGVVVVTTGLLGRLDRMQLEAVVAHLLVQIRDGFSAAATMSLAFRPSRPAPPVPFTLVDSKAVTLTRYPPALASALEVLAAAGPAAPERASTVLRPVWLVPPGDRDAAGARVEALRAL